MIQVSIGGRDLVMTHSTGPDDAESLEFWYGPGRTSSDLVLAITFFDRSESPLLIHVPGEIEAVLLEQALHLGRRWISDNLPGTSLLE
jgi:hypothetical protein